MFQQAGGFVGRGRQYNLKLVFDHKFEGAGRAGGIHFAKGLIEQRQPNGVGGSRLVDAIGLGE